jgi:hypothetical protein
MQQKNPQQPAHCWLLGAKLAQQEAHSPLSQGHRTEKALCPRDNLAQGMWRLQACSWGSVEVFAKKYDS